MQLLERETQLRLLDDALREVDSGVGSVALVYGEAGIGKTSLVEHFLRQHTDSYRILRGACDALFAPRPLGPLHDIAQHTRGTLLKKLEAAADRTAIFSAALAELSGEPTIALIEDIHWADEATLDLLRYIGRRIRQTSSLLLLTYRDDEIGMDHPLRRLLGDPGTSGSLHRIPISALSKDAVQELARNKQVNALELYRLTNGNAFYVTEVLAADGGIPETIRDAVLARAARLSGREQKILEAAAVLGPRIEPWLLSRVSAADAEMIARCLATGLLKVQADIYMFRHELIRQTILDSASPHKKVALHRLALAALQEAAETRADLARLANHAEGTREASLVLEYAPAAARQAATAGAHRQAAALYELALRYAEALPLEQHAQMMEAYADERWFQSLDGNPPLRREIIAKYRNLGDRLREGKNLALLAAELKAAGQYSESEGAIRAALTILEALPPGAELALAYRAQGYLRLARGEFLDSVEPGEKAIALAEILGEVDILARSCNFVGYALLLMGDERGHALMERGLAVGREHGLHWAVGLLLANWTDTLVQALSFERAQPLLQEGIAYTTRHDDDIHLAHTLSNQASMWRYQGRWDNALVLLEEMLHRSEFKTVMGAEILLTKGRIGARRGIADSEEALAAGLRMCIQSRSLEGQLTARAVLAEAAWLRGDLQQALEEARQAYDAAVGQHLPWFAGELAFWRWRANDESNPPAWIAQPFALQIAGDWRAAAAMWEKYGCPYEHGMALMDGDEAAQLQALQIFERLGARPIIDRLKRQMRARGIRRIPRGPRPSTRTNAFGLTARELEVLGFLVQGSTNSAIANQLSLSTRTVEHHIASILQKTGTQSRGEAVAVALRENLVSSG